MRSNYLFLLTYIFGILIFIDVSILVGSSLSSSDLKEEVYPGEFHWTRLCRYSANALMMIFTVISSWWYYIFIKNGLQKSLLSRSSIPRVVLIVA